MNQEQTRTDALAHKLAIEYATSTIECCAVRTTRAGPDCWGWYDLADVLDEDLDDLIDATEYLQAIDRLVVHPDCGYWAGVRK